VAVYAFLGFMIVIMFLNLVHPASHCALFKEKKHNRRFMLLFDFIGGNSYMWNRRHLKLHHNFTNVKGWDSDIEKLSFLSGSLTITNKTQLHFKQLAFLLYPLFIANWFLLRDFKDFFFSKMIVKKLGKIPATEFAKLFITKFIFTGYILVIPIWVTSFTVAQVLIAFLVLLLAAGLLALVVLIPPHVNSANQFHQSQNNAGLKHSWLMHQLHVTNDVTTNNWFTRNVMANCNFHIVHHLFPYIHPVYAKEITDTIVKYSLKESLPYKALPLLTTFRQHFELVTANACWCDILEEEM
jgi:linoleoyl-CoA desaturase